LQRERCHSRKGVDHFKEREKNSRQNSAFARILQKVLVLLKNFLKKLPCDEEAVFRKWLFAKSVVHIS
jgi:hypothetical protein